MITTYAPRMVVVGERPRLAGVAKLIANFLQVSAMDLMGQSLALAERSGLPPELAPQLLAAFFGNPGTREYIAKIGQRDFDDVGFTAAGGSKDVTLMIATADEVSLRLSSAEAVRAKLKWPSNVRVGATRTGAASPISTAPDRHEIRTSTRRLPMLHQPACADAEADDYKERFVEDHCWSGGRTAFSWRKRIARRLDPAQRREPPGAWSVVQDDRRGP